MKFYVTLVETLERVVEVDAENINEAKLKAENNYRKCDKDYILTPDNSNVFFEVGEIND